MSKITDAWEQKWEIINNILDTHMTPAMARGLNLDHTGGR